MNIFINKVLFLIIFFAIIVFSIWIGFRILGLLLPFIIAYFLSKPLHALIKKINSKYKPITALLLVTSFFALFVTGISLIIYKSIKATSGLASQITAASNLVQQFADSSTSKVLSVPWQSEPIVLSDLLIEFYDLLFGFFSDVVNFVVNKVFLVIMTIPNIGLFIFFVFISLYFFTKDHDTITNFIFQWINRIESPRIHEIKIYTLKTFKNYFKALLTLVSISFSISLVSLTILRVPFAPLIALMVAIVDFIPLIGPAIIYVPWIIFLFLFSEYSMAFALLVIYLTTTLTRQILEPKIISSKIGANPLITIIAMYVCYRILGVIGLIAGPILVMLGLIIYKSYQAASKNTNI